MTFRTLILFLVTSLTPVSKAATPPAALGAYVKQSIQSLPHWLDAYEARWEQPELEAIRQDNENCLTAVDDETFHQAVEKLKADWGALVALDNKIQRELQI